MYPTSLLLKLQYPLLPQKKEKKKKKEDKIHLKKFKQEKAKSIKKKRDIATLFVD
jgi:hypothetical protein